MNAIVFDVLKTVGRGNALTVDAAEAFMDELMAGNTTGIQTAAVLAAMAVRGETVEEIVGFARAMRNHSIHMNAPVDVVDTCGTGGDGADTFNISTTAAILAAAAGVPIAKHGNRAASSKSGSADVLTALGARIDLTVEAGLQCLFDTNLCFLFAQLYHPAMKHAAEPRKQLGFRTIFNILGPLTNPAHAKRQVLGVFREDLVTKVADALLALGSEHVMVVHGAGGIDEISLQGETTVAEVLDGRVHTYTICPEDVGLARAPVAALAGGDAMVNADILQRILAGEKGPRRDVVVFNAGATLYVAGIAPDIETGVRLAEQTIDDGRALQRLHQYIAMTQRLSPSEVANG